MRRSVPIASGDAILRLPTWGRSFWRDPNDGNLILLYASGNNEVGYVTSSDSGVTWSDPTFAFPVDNFEVHNNFDAVMDRNGNVHCGHRYNSSGCYSLIAKDFITGDWSPSGVIARGFIDVVDNGEARGFNGSVEVTDTFVGPFSFADVGGPFPVVRLQAKGTINGSGNIVNAYWIPNPFTTYPQEDIIAPGLTLKDVGSLFPAGREGGYPVFTRTGSGGRQVVYMVDGTGFISADNFFGGWYFLGTPVDDSLGEFVAGTVEGSGYVSRLPFTPNMTHLEANPFVGPSNDRRVVQHTYFLLSDDINGNTNWEMMVAANETQMVGGRGDSGGANSDVFVRIEGSGNYAAPIGERRSRAPNGMPFREVLPSINRGFANSSGNLVDMSYGDDGNKIYLYFLSNEQDGEQVISRLQADITRDFVGGVISGETFAAQTNTISIGDLTSATSGIKSWAPAGTQYVGGSGNSLTWNGFKAVRHPVPAFSGVNKQEILATAGSGLDGKYRIVGWDFNKSITGEGRQKLATWTVQHTGVITAVSGITFFQAQNLIDGFTVTGNSMSNGDSLTIDFEEELRFDRIEVLWNETFGGNPYHGIRIESSINGTDFTRVATVPQGYTLGILGGTALIKLSSELDIFLPDTTITHRMVPFYGRYIRYSLEGSLGGNKDTRQLRFYGAHSSAGEWVTEAWTRNFVEPGLEFSPAPERFDVTPEDELPDTLTTYGDFTWGTKTSGTLSNGFITEPSSFQGQAIGNGDGFAVRTARTGITSGQSGILEAVINVAQNEVAFDNTPGRTIEFDARYHLVGTGPLLDQTDPSDDKFYFEAVTPTGTYRVYYPGNFPKDENDLCTTNICNYFTYRTTVPTGTITLRWVYERGTTPEPGVVDDEGHIWIDNIVGIKSVILNSINGFIAGRNPSTADFTGESGVYGFMAKKFAESVYGYMNSTEVNRNSAINAFMQGRTTITGSVNAYTAGFMADSVYAYTKGFFPSVDSSVNAFMVTSGAFGSVLGHMQNRLNDTINGYLLGPSGAFSSVNAYLITPEFSIINGYVKGPGSGVSQVNAYLDANGNQESVYGFLFGSGIPSGNINGFLFNNGVSSQVFGKIAVGDSSDIYGYLTAATGQNSTVYAWISGIGLAASEVNAYMPAVSGAITGVINAYTKAHETENGAVFATMIGFGDDTQCNFPLSALPTVVIPTGNFFV